MWKGFVSFGLVAIPVQLVNAVESHSEIHFHLLHKKDQGRIRNKRVCELCGQDVPWPDIVKGYEYDDDLFVTVTDEDFEKADVGQSSTIDILDFVKASEVDPRLFERPTYLEPQRGGEKPYALLRTTLEKSGRVGIAKIVLRTRQSLACLMPWDAVLLLEILRFPDEVRGTSELKVPGKAAVPARELELAQKLVSQMSGRFDPEKYRDDWKEKIEAILEEKTKGLVPEARGRAPVATRPLDLVKVLERSLAGREPATVDGDGASRGRKKTAAHARSKRKRAA
jgi:DNA end-binding protein Ku